MFSVLEIMALEHVAEISFMYIREYISSSINVLPNSPKISHLTNKDVLQLNVPWIKGKL